MRASDSAARISVLDVTDLGRASNKLALVAQTIRSHKTTWGDPVVELLIDVNNVVVRIQQKGTRAFERFYERHRTAGAPGAADLPAGDDPSAGDVPTRQDEEKR